MVDAKHIIGIQDVTPKRDNLILKCLLAEFIGNLLLNFFGCGAVVNVAGLPSSHVLIALTFGFTIFIIVQTLGHVSGAHVNPAVTCGMVFTGNCSVLKGLLYILAQMVGAITGSALLMAVTPEDQQVPGMGITSLNNNLTYGQGWCVEFFLGFVLVLTVFGVCDPNRPESKPAGALAIGLAVAVGHLAAIDATGASMNPARTFGSSVIANHWDHHAMYWSGPIFGGIVAGLLYKYAFSAPPITGMKIIERYTAVAGDEKELKRLDGGKHEEA